MNLVQIGNLLEAMVWLTISAVLVARSTRVRGHAGLLRILAATFAVFGLSDLIEIQSGAWWRPAWLLAVKAICILSFGVCLTHYLRTKPPTAEGDSTVL